MIHSQCNPSDDVGRSSNQACHQEMIIQSETRSLGTAIEDEWTTWSTLCEGDVLHCVMVVTPDTD